MRVYHSTPVAETILKEGFRDNVGFYMLSVPVTGVWLSDTPLSCNEGAKGDVVLRLEIPEEALLSFEVIEEGKPYREFCVPANVVNGFKIEIDEETLYYGASESETIAAIERLEAHEEPMAKRQARKLRAAFDFAKAYGLLVP